MPILKREDGVQFAIHTYRELLPLVKASVLKNEIRTLAQQHGEYVRFFKQPNGQIEGVFSRDPGYLLGETVWQYFGKPKDLIYCEELPEGHYAILVIVRGGTVYLDTKIPLTNIPDELTSLISGINQYDIYVYGDVPLSTTRERGKFVFDKSQVKSFTRLDQSVFNLLPADPNLQLQPLEFALRAQKIGRRIPVVWIILGALILIALGWWYHLETTKPPPVVQPSAPEAQVDPYAGYKSSLQNPAPEKQLAELANLVAVLYSLPGWQVNGVTFDGSNYTIQIISTGGSVALLNRWAKSHNMNMSLNSQGGTLSFRSLLSSRSEPDTIFPANQVTYTLIDKINQVLPQQSIVLGGTAPFPNYKTVNLTIQFSSISPEVLNLIGRQLTGLPIKLNSVTLTTTDSLLSGTIQLTVLGN